MKPAIMHFISDIPEPAAYRAKVLTRDADNSENIAFKDERKLWYERGKTHCT